MSIGHSNDRYYRDLTEQKLRHLGWLLSRQLLGSMYTYVVVCCMCSNQQTALLLLLIPRTGRGIISPIIIDSRTPNRSMLPPTTTTTNCTTVNLQRRFQVRQLLLLLQHSGVRRRVVCADHGRCTKIIWSTAYSKSWRLY